MVAAGGDEVAVALAAVTGARSSRAVPDVEHGDELGRCLTAIKASRTWRESGWCSAYLIPNLA
jgi:hypothetical protein